VAHGDLLRIGGTDDGSAAPRRPVGRSGARHVRVAHVVCDPAPNRSRTGRRGGTVGFVSAQFDDTGERK